MEGRLQVKSVLEEFLGESIHTCDPVRGGDIHAAYRIRTGRNTYFLKTNESKYVAILKAETDSLNTLRMAFQGVCPEVFLCGSTESSAFLLREWLESSIAGERDGLQFGRQLARMHGVQQSYFGFSEDNYIGILAQSNKPCNSWTEFFIQQRIMPQLISLINAKKAPSSTLLLVDSLAQKMEQLFSDEPPALLHGDLWSGNCMHTDLGFALFDPAIYYGHREMDIAMTLLFGGFPDLFYTGYAEINPLEAGWKKRVSLCQLYPILVHANLFGGPYINRSLEILAEWTC